MWNVAANTGSHPNVWKIQQLSQTNDEALTSASFASRASSCNWKSLRSISSLARSASSLICFSRARIWRSIWMKAKEQNHSKNNHLWSNSYDFSFHMYVCMNGLHQVILQRSWASTDLLPGLLLFSLSLHLLHFNGVHLPPPHEQVVVTDAQLQDLGTQATQTGDILLYITSLWSNIYMDLEVNQPACWHAVEMSRTWKHLSSCPEVWLWTATWESYKFQFPCTAHNTF